VPTIVRRIVSALPPSFATGFFAIALVASAASVAAQEAPAKVLGWSGEAALSFVAVDGNSKSQSLAFSGKWVDTFEAGALVVETAGLRAETTTIARTAVGTPTDFTVIESETTNETAENYLLRGRYDGDLAPDLVWFAGLGWERNTFAGFDSRLVGIGGLGKTWIATEATRFRTDAGITYTVEEPSSPGLDSDSFAGLLLGWDFSHALTATTKFANVLQAHPNLEETDDWRLDDLSTLTVAMSERLGLQLGLRLLYDNRPSLERVDLPVGSPAPQFVFVERDDLDTWFTTSLVWKM
jgi:putative salt-induced outer membrane protein YdiY